MLNRSLRAAIALLFVAGPAAAAPKLDSVDHRGNCRKGVPTERGQTRITQAGRSIELVAFGSEYGHHCGEDQGRFAFVELTGDFDVAVRVAAVTNHGAKHFRDHATPAKAGIMARESNEAGVRYVAIWAVSNDALDHYPDSFHFDLRRSPNAWLGSTPKGEFTYGYANKRDQPRPGMFQRAYPNVWVRLRRQGSSFAAFVSKDGKDWQPTSTPAHEINLPGRLLVGVALSSAPEGNFNARSTARFEEVSGLGARAMARRSP